VRSLNQILNTKIEEKAKVLVSYIESITRSDVKKVFIKFLEDVQGEVFCTGMINDILYLPKGSEGV
jgi:hypothetical protein